MAESKFQIRYCRTCEDETEHRLQERRPAVYECQDCSQTTSYGNPHLPDPGRRMSENGGK